MADIDEEVREIKREIIESRGLVIKASNLTNALAADIKSIAKRQVGYERRFNWNSWVAYVLFAGLSFIGLKLASDARIREIESGAEELRREVTRLSRELHEETDRSERRTRAEASSAQLYRLIRDRRRAEAIAQYHEVRREELSPAEAAFFRDVIDRFHEELSIQAYQNGMELARTGRHAEAAQVFQEALRLREEGVQVPAVKLELARSLRSLGQQSRAKQLAAEVAEQTVDRELQDDGLLLFAACSESLGLIDDALSSLRTYLRRWPRGAFATDVRRQASELARRSARGEVARPGA